MPSFSRYAFSFCLVRNKLVFTVFTPIPYRPAMSSMRSAYQYRRRNTLHAGYIVKL